MAGEERQSTHRNYVGAREVEYRGRNGYANRWGPSSHDAQLAHWERESHQRYRRNWHQEPYTKPRSSYQEGSYSHPNQWEDEQGSAGLFPTRSSTRPASPRRMRTSRERTSSEANDNNQSIRPSPRPSLNRSTRIDSDQNISTIPASQPPRPGPSASTTVESDQNISNPPVSQPSHPGPSSSSKRSLEGNATPQPVSSSSKPAETSAVISQSIVSNSGENQTESSSRNSEIGSQAMSTSKDASNQQVSPTPRPGVSCLKNASHHCGYFQEPPSLVQNTVLKKSEKSSQKSGNEPRLARKDEPKFIQLVSEHPHLYDPADPSFRDKEQKKRSWTSIGATFGHSADRCESTWRSIRQKHNQWKMKMAARVQLPKELQQFMKDMSFLPLTQKSIATKITPQTESFDSDQALLNSIVAELRRLSPDQNALLRSKLYGILAEFSKVV